MGQLKFIENMIEKQMLNLHTAFLAKILDIFDNSAKIQPLGLLKEEGGGTKAFAPVSYVPITQQAKYKLIVQDGIINATPVAVGDIVICVCCDRDITGAKIGKSVLPPSGHHSMSDCIIIGVL